MSTWEDIFSSWAQGPGKTEADKCDNAEAAVRKAIAADRTLSRLDTTVFAQGSYKARTNVKQDSDVDICVRYDGGFFESYPEGKTRAAFGNVEGSLNFSDFKNMVEHAHDRV
jgi:tRNA nucleotidyltransferase (CCA-adding enzyme)